MKATISASHFATFIAVVLANRNFIETTKTHTRTTRTLNVSELGTTSGGSCFKHHGGNRINTTEKVSPKLDRYD